MLKVGDLVFFSDLPLYYETGNRFYEIEKIEEDRCLLKGRKEWFYLCQLSKPSFKIGTQVFCDKNKIRTIVKCFIGYDHDKTLYYKLSNSQDIYTENEIEYCSHINIGDVVNYNGRNYFVLNINIVTNMCELFFDQEKVIKVPIKNILKDKKRKKNV